MESNTSSSTKLPTRIIFACIRCAERKVKCDRQRPCSACTKHHAECVFNTSKPPRKKHKRIKIQFLTDRLSQYESILQEHGIDTSKIPGSITKELPSRLNEAATPGLTEAQVQAHASIEADRTNQTGHVLPQVHDSRDFKYVENALWTRVVEEAHDPADTLDSSDDSSDEDASDDGHAFVLMNSAKPKSRPRYPPSEVVHQLWDIFVENVDPLTKVVHVPTLKPAFQKTAADSSRAVPRGFEALMFAIYSTAIMSLRDEECMQRFSEPHRSLLSRYTRATSAALSRARFMSTTSLIVLQALVLHLLAVRDIYEPRALYSLTGMAIRIAQVMGLERDGTFLGLTPFETELRRRIWWQLKTHDFRTAELCGLAKFRDLDMGAGRTKWPTNVDDDQLYPTMPSIVAAENRVTDILFVAFRCEMTEFAVGRIAKLRKQGLTTDQWNMDKARHDKGEIENAVKGLQDMLETEYLRYCDPSRPLHLLTMLVGRYGMNVVQFLSHHPRSWTSMDHVSPTERQLVWDVSVKLLEQHNMVQSNPMLKNFSWHATYFRQWHAFIHVLDILRAEPLKEDASKLWVLITSTYDNTPAMLSDMKKPIHVAIGNLCLKAYASREAAISKANSYLPPVPDFVVRLRQWREDLKQRRKERSTKNSSTQGSHNHERAGNFDVDQSFTYSILNASDPAAFTFSRGNALAYSQNHFNPQASADDHAFYLFDQFDDQTEDPGINFDFTMPEDYSMDDSSFEPINWG